MHETFRPLRGLGVAAAFLLLALAASWPTLHNGFTGDDFIWLYDASQARSPRDLLAVHDVPFAPYDGVRLNPTTSLFFALGWWMFGLQTLPWHLFALGLYVATALAVRAWLRELEVGETWAATGGALFLLLPVHAQPVAWLSATGEILVGLFTVLSLRAWVRWRRGGRLLWLVVSLLWQTCALLAKESALVLPVLLLLVDLVILRARLRAQVAPWALAGLVAAWKAAVLGASRADIGIHPGGVGAADALVGTFQVLAATAAGAARPLRWGRSVALAGSSLGVLAAALALTLRGGHRTVAFHLAWMVVAVQPYVWWVPNQTLYERYTWQASIPLVCLAALAADAAAGRLRRPGRAALAVAAAAALLVLGLTLRTALGSLQSPDDTDRMARSLREALRGVSAGDSVYVYNTLTAENAAGRAVVLLGGASEGQVREWYDALQRAGLERTDRFVHFDMTSRIFTDVTDSVKSARRLTKGRLDGTRHPRELVERLADARGLDTWQHSAALTVEGSLVQTSGFEGVLCSPRLDLSPWAVYAVDVLYVPRSGEVTMALAWRSDEQPAGGGDMAVGPLFTAPVPGGQLARFIPADAWRWWTGGGIHHLDLVPSTRPATLEVLDVRVYTFGRLR